MGATSPAKLVVGTAGTTEEVTYRGLLLLTIALLAPTADRTVVLAEAPISGGGAGAERGGDRRHGRRAGPGPAGGRDRPARGRAPGGGRPGPGFDGPASDAGVPPPWPLREPSPNAVSIPTAESLYISAPASAIALSPGSSSISTNGMSLPTMR